MPVVFSPGEAETRPLNPEEIVYTTAQKVADLLGIGPGEAVLAGHDSDTDGVYVTGADYRDHGFQSGDTILVYSDDDPMGFEKKIIRKTGIEYQGYSEETSYGPTRYYDKKGRYQGYSEKSSYGPTRYYDKKGRLKGTSEESKYGPTRYYDKKGRLKGSSQ